MEKITAVKRGMKEDGEISNRRDRQREKGSCESDIKEVVSERKKNLYVVPLRSLLTPFCTER